MPRCDICEQPAYKTCHMCMFLHTYFEKGVTLCKEHWGDNPDMCKNCTRQMPKEINYLPSHRS